MTDLNMVLAGERVTAEITNRPLGDLLGACGYERTGASFTGFRRVVNVLALGAVGDGTADDTVAIQSAITIAGSTGKAAVYFPIGNYKVTSTLQVSVARIKFVGDGQDESTILYTGSGACVQIHEDDGQAYDSGLYNGKQGFELHDMSLRHGAAATVLANGLGNYQPGTYGIRDWRGGSLRLTRASIRHFEYGIWGIESDVNEGANLFFGFNKIAVWMGPRCDQQSWSHVWTSGNDTVWQFEGCANVRVTKWHTDTDGSGSTSSVVIRNWALTSRPFANIVFDQPWLEAASTFGDTNPGFDVEAFFSVGDADASTGRTVVINDPVVLVYLYSDATRRHVLYLVKQDRGVSVTVNRLTSYSGGFLWTNLRAVFKQMAGDGHAVQPIIWFSEVDRIAGRLAENHAASPIWIHLESHLNNAQLYTNNVVGGTGAINMGEVALTRILWDATAAPTTGTYTQGSWTRNQFWDLGQALLWVSRGNGTHFPLIIDSIASDKGDASATLTSGTDPTFQRWSTTLTQDRSVTLATAGPGGAALSNGGKFRITRTGGGAFSLNVGSGPLKTLAQNEWCDVMYDGAAWRLTAYGAL